MCSASKVPWAHESAQCLWQICLPKASNKLKTRSLSQSNSVPSKARIILRVSYQDHYLGDVAILNLGKSSSRVQSWVGTMLVTDLLAEECRVASCSWSVSELRVHDSSSDVEILTPLRASKLIAWRKVRRYVPHLSPWCRVQRNVEPVRSTSCLPQSCPDFERPRKSWTHRAWVKATQCQAKPG